MASRSPSNFFAVKSSKHTGVYVSWEACAAFLRVCTTSVVYKHFSSNREAEEFVWPRASSNSWCMAPPSTFAEGNSKYVCVFSGGESENRGIFSSWEEFNAYTKELEGSSCVMVTCCESKMEAEAHMRGDWRYSGDQHSQSQEGVAKHSARDSDSSDSEDEDDFQVVFCCGLCEESGYGEVSGGIGVFWENNHSFNLSEKLGGSTQTKTRAELMAACRALEGAIKQGIRNIEIHINSFYTIRTVTQLVPVWKSDGWQTHSKYKRELQKIDKLCQRLDSIKWRCSVYQPGSGAKTAATFAQHGARMCH